MLLIQVAQQAKEVAPQVWVTVQQPPPGMPEWLTILITAAVGAILGISTNIATEYLKPGITRKLNRRRIRRILNAREFKN